MVLNDRLTGRIVVVVFVLSLVTVTLWHLLHLSDHFPHLVPSPLYAFVIIRYLFLLLSLVILAFMIYACVNANSRA